MCRNKVVRVLSDKYLRLAALNRVLTVYLGCRCSLLLAVVLPSSVAAPLSMSARASLLQAQVIHRKAQADATMDRTRPTLT